MSQNIKKAFRLSVIMQKVSEKCGKIKWPGFGGNLGGRWIPHGHMQAPVHFICHGHKEVNFSQLTFGSLYPVDPACSNSSLSPVHLEKLITLIVSSLVSLASPQPRNTTSGQMSNSATWYSYGQTSRI